MLLQNLHFQHQVGGGVNRKLTQSDNHVREAIAAARGDFKEDEGAFSTETKLLQSDPSYATHAATTIGASGSSDP
jgi:hypothetical protein